MDTEQTIKYVVSNKVSVSRYGDGEYEIMRNRGNGFQNYEKSLSERLKEVLNKPIANHLVCIPIALNSVSLYKEESRIKWISFICRNWRTITKNTPINRIYGNSLCTRFYIIMDDTSKSGDTAESLKQIWADRDVCIIEGQNTRLGVGNDLLNGCKSVKRIICPAQDAWEKYDEIIDAVCKNVNKNKLILCALGMTATVLSFDLAKLGYQAIDIGHIDLEYEWMRMGVNKKCDVPGKAVNELGHNIVQPIEAPYYDSEILLNIG